jgi:hypothetical protein
MGRKGARAKLDRVKLQQPKSSKTSWLPGNMNVMFLSVPAVVLALVFCYSLRDRAPAADQPVVAIGNRSLDNIDRRSGLSLQEFIDVYDGRWPVLITDAMTDWPASTKWDWSYFLERYASHKVAMKAVHVSTLA